MKSWYRAVYAAGAVGDADLHKSLDACDAYEIEYEEAKKDIRGVGKIESKSSEIGALAEHRYAQLQDLESILDHLETRERKAAVEKTRQFMEHYQRTLTYQQAKDYASGSDEVQLIIGVKQRVAFVRNLYLGISKGLEFMHFQINNVTRMRSAGLEDAVFTYGRES